MLIALRALGLAAVLAGPSAALATTPVLPPVSSRTAAGIWEGLCQFAPDEIGADIHVVRLRMAPDGSGTLALGEWFGGDNPFVGRVLKIAKADVKSGSVKMLATLEGSDGWEDWKVINLAGVGRANSSEGWLKLQLVWERTKYRCEVLLLKAPTAEGLFKDVSAAVGKLNELERNARDAGKVGGRPTRR